MNLYRAASSTATSEYTSFAEVQADAEYYLDNTGFGGPILYRVTAPSSDRVLVLDGSPTQCMREFLEDAGLDRDQIEEIFMANFSSCVGSLRSAREWTADIFASMAERYDWVVFSDSAPDGCRTWMSLGADLSQLTWTEIQPSVKEVEPGKEFALDADGGLWSLADAREIVAEDGGEMTVVFFPGEWDYSGASSALRNGLDMVRTGAVIR